MSFVAGDQKNSRQTDALPALKREVLRLLIR